MKEEGEKSAAGECPMSRILRGGPLGKRVRQQLGTKILRPALGGTEDGWNVLRKDSIKKLAGWGETGKEAS